MGRWRREGWPADRDSPFDAVLHSLWSETDEALRRQLNARLGEDYVVGDESTALAPLPPDAEVRRKEIQDKLREAAQELATADRLLDTDPALTDEGYRKAVNVARKAFDICADTFRGSILGPFVKYKPGRSVASGRSRQPGGSSSALSPAQASQLSPEAAAWRLRKLGEYMKKDPIDVIAYDPRWAEEGLAHTEAVAGALGPLALRVDHIGSTAVPGLAAKDVIDVQALVSRLEDDGIAAAMEAPSPAASSFSVGVVSQTK